MSEASKPTLGVWYIEKYSDGSLQIHGNLNDVSDDEAKYSVVAECVRSHEDAALIAEAGTVHHETGLTPRQLVEQRDALAKAIESFLKAEPSPESGFFSDEENEALEACEAALALVKGGEK